MHIALPTTDKRPQIHHISAGVANNNSSSQKQEPLEARIKAANAELAKHEIRNKEQSQLPSNAQLIEDIRKKFDLPKNTEMHFHKQKRSSGEVMIDTATQKPLKIAEFVSKDHKCSEPQMNALHQAPVVFDQKKTSICTGTHCKPAPERPKGFFQSLFSTAA